MPMVHDLMEENSIKYEQLDALACTVGPGSFTGIRIGVSAVKTMAMALTIGAVPVSSLRAMAYPLKEEEALIVPMIDCRNHRAWAGGFYHDEEVVPECADDVDVILDACRKWRDEKLPEKKILLIGNGAKVLSAEELPEGVEYVPDHEDIRSEDVAFIAEQIAEKVVHDQSGKEDRTSPRTILASAFAAVKMMPVYRAKTQAERMAGEQGKQVENIPIRYYSTMDEEK